MPLLILYFLTKKMRVRLYFRIQSYHGFKVTYSEWHTNKPAIGLGSTHYPRWCDRVLSPQIASREEDIMCAFDEDRKFSMHLPVYYIHRTSFGTKGMGSMRKMQQTPVAAGTRHSIFIYML